MLGRGRDILPGAVSRPRALRAGERDLEVYIGVPPPGLPKTITTIAIAGTPIVRVTGVMAAAGGGSSSSRTLDGFAFAMSSGGHRSAPGLP